MRFYQKWKVWLSLFFMINLWNDTGSHHILSSQCIWLLVIKLKYSKYSFCFSMLQYVVSQDLSKGKNNCRLYHNYNPYSFHIHNCLFSTIRGCTCEQISWYWFKANIPLNKNAQSMLNIQMNFDRQLAYNMRMLLYSVTLPQRCENVMLLLDIKKHTYL